jgi:hypothetical protein
MFSKIVFLCVALTLTTVSSIKAEVPIVAAIPVSQDSADLREAVIQTAVAIPTTEQENEQVARLPATFAEFYPILDDNGRDKNCEGEVETAAKACPDDFTKEESVEKGTVQVIQSNTCSTSADCTSEEFCKRNSRVLGLGSSVNECTDARPFKDIKCIYVTHIN